MIDKDIEEFTNALSKLSTVQREKFLLNLERVTFKFTINKSYLKDSAHPITVPIEYHSFLDMHKITPSIDMPVVFPFGSNATGYLYYYSGTSKKEPYRQIKIRNPYSGEGPAAFQEGDVIKIEIFKVDGSARILINKVS